MPNSSDLSNAADPLLSLPFDCYQRYSVTQRVIASLWPQGQRPPLKILDVGGHASSLKHFLPKDEVVLADILPPPPFTHRENLPFRHDGYVLAVGQSLPFSAATFDIVTAHDTLEHVPLEHRKSFLREILRVARRFVVINGPVYHPATARLEKRLSQFIRRAGIQENAYLNEHLELGLPPKELIEGVLTEEHLPFVMVSNGTQIAWLATMALKHYLQALPQAEALLEAIDRAYNAFLSPQDFGEQCYREAYVVAKDPGDRERLLAVQAAFAPSAARATPLGDPLATLEPLLVALEEHAIALRRELLPTLPWRHRLEELERAQADLQAALQERDEALQQKDSLLAEREALLRQREALLVQARQELEEVQGSLGYRLLEAYRRAMRWLFPPGSWRGVPYRLLRAALRFLLPSSRDVLGPSRLGRARRLAARSIRIVRTEGWRAFFHKAKRRLTIDYGHSGYQAQAELVRETGPLRLPKPDQPQVSIVIPVHNKSLYTYNCLLSLVEYSGQVPYEVIVVDDASTDDTPSVLRQVENLKVIRNASNLGFVQSCNKGAEAAAAPYLLILNNDTKVQPGWLEALMETVKGDPRVGLVGPKLVYPNGRLQEAGGIVWRDGSAWNYGRHDDPEKPEYNYVREVDYCSGACILVRRELFQAAGAFDPRYAPAYYEDTDLAFTVRQMGYKVLYQPRAVVIHFEGISAGTDTASGMKRYQEINRSKFTEKWRPVLEKDHLPPARDLARARDRRSGNRILVIDHHVPTHDRDSGSLRMFNLLRLLAEMGFVITFVPANLARLEPYTQQLQQMGIEVLYGPLDVADHLRALGGHLRLCIVSRPDVAVDYVPLIRKIAPGAVLIYDTVDLHFLREARRAEVEKSESAKRAAQRYRDLELLLARSCDATLVVTEEEKRLLEQELPGLPIYVVPNVHEVRAGGQPWSQRSGLLFIGNFLHPPNRDAVVYFAREVLPIIKEELPEAAFYIVGGDAPHDVQALASRDVIVKGWVPDVTPYLESCRVFVAPLRYGAGLKGKVGQSMACGLPVVTTSLGVEGMDVRDGREVLIADDPREFARKVVQLYRDQDMWQEISQQGMRYVAHHYSPEVVKGNLKGLLAAQGLAWAEDGNREREDTHAGESIAESSRT